MSNIADNIHQKYLTELNNFERTLQDENLKEFEAWRQKVQNSLEGSYRVRFSKLVFFEKKQRNFANDIPF